MCGSVCAADIPKTISELHTNSTRHQLTQKTQGRTRPAVNDSAFTELGLNQPLCVAVTAAGYDTPTPIQHKAIPDVLAGHDLLGCAQTGTGKTAAFALPILQHLTGEPGLRVPRALILAPTRELAAQIGASFAKYGRRTGLRHLVIFGGVNKGPQKKALREGIDILVATPGRLLDLMGEGFIDLRRITHFVLDEADRMLDMGFIHDVRRKIVIQRSRASARRCCSPPPCRSAIRSLSRATSCATRSRSRSIPSPRRASRPRRWSTSSRKTKSSTAAPSC